MKICPSCRRTYSDDSLNFCLDDGSVLTLKAPDPQETLVMNPPGGTSPAVAPTDPSGVPTSWNTVPQDQFTMRPPKKKSRVWLWVVGIFAVLILICGGGFFAVITMVDWDSIARSTNTGNSSRNWNTQGNDRANASNSSTPSSPGSGDDIDMTGWAKQPSSWGTTQFSNGELVMNSKDKGFYFVQVALDKYETQGATTRVTLRNIDNGNTSLGYGMIFHSDPTPLNKDYGFLIDTKRTRYRIVQHSPAEERTIKTWTNSAAIKAGGQENTLEVRDKAGELEFYINGTKVTSFTNTAGPKSGVPGIYAGDGIKIGFKKLQVIK